MLFIIFIRFYFYTLYCNYSFYSFSSFKLGLENAKDNALLELLSRMLADPAYQQLRNVEQLGVFLAIITCLLLLIVGTCRVYCMVLF